MDLLQITRQLGLNKKKPENVVVWFSSCDYVDIDFILNSSLEDEIPKGKIFSYNPEHYCELDNAKYLKWEKLVQFIGYKKAVNIMKISI